MGYGIRNKEDWGVAGAFWTSVGKAGALWFSKKTKFPGLRRYANFGPRHETSLTKRYPHTLHPATAQITQSIQDESVWKSPLCRQSNHL